MKNLTGLVDMCIESNLADRNKGNKQSDDSESGKFSWYSFRHSLLPSD